MRIAFIWPHANTSYQTLPLSLGLLHTNIKGDGHVSKLFNLPLEGWRADSPEFKQAIRDFRPDLIAVSAWAVTFKSSVTAVRAAREQAPGAITVIGGNYPTLNADQAYAPGCFDYVIMGEAERTFRDFLRLLEAGDEQALERLPGMYFTTKDGRLVRNRNQFVEDLDELGYVDWEFIELERAFQRGYMRTVLGPRRKVAILATRGCEYGCNFCTAPLMNGKKLRYWSVDFMVQQFALLYERYGVRMLYLMDDNATQDRAYFKDLCRGIASLGHKDLTVELYRGVRLENLDAEMLALMKAAGFKILTIAPESGSDRVRSMMNKAMERADIVRAARMIREAGLSLQAYFIIGYPGETAEEREMTYAMIHELGLDVFSLHKYQALPGTGSFLRLVKSGQIAREHTDESHLIGEALPNYNGDLPQDIDREILLTYARFYARRPWSLLHLLRMASAGGLWRSIGGTTKAGMRSLVGLGRSDTFLPSIREPM